MAKDVRLSAKPLIKGGFMDVDLPAIIDKIGNMQLPGVPAGLEMVRVEICNLTNLE